MDLETAVTFVRDHRRAVLVTIRGNGRPQLSNVLHDVDADGAIRISITATRAKYANLVRQPWAALHVTQDDFWAYAVVEGGVTLSAIVQAPDDDAANLLVDYYRSIRGEHPDWDEYRASLVSEQRVLVRLHPGRAYGMLPETT